MQAVSFWHFDSERHCIIQRHHHLWQHPHKPCSVIPSLGLSIRGLCWPPWSSSIRRSFLRMTAMLVTFTTTTAPVPFFLIRTTVGTQIAEMKMSPAIWKGFDCQSYDEETTSFGNDEQSFMMVRMVDQLNTTWDKTDYLWYTTDVKTGPSERFLSGGKWPVLKVLSAGSALHVFINGKLSGGLQTRVNPSHSETVYCRFLFSFL